MPAVLTENRTIPSSVLFTTSDSKYAKNAKCIYSSTFIYFKIHNTNCDFGINLEIKIRYLHFSNVFFS